MGKLLLEAETYAIRGAAIEVHRELGFGFLEAVYQEALEIEFADRGIPFEPQKALSIRYKQRQMQKKYIPDFVCHAQIIVEIKCVPKLGDVEMAQMINYLKATGYKVGLLINFGSKGKLEIERVVL